MLVPMQAGEGWNSRRRFRETMRFGAPDRVPYFEEGIREETVSAWHGGGLPKGVSVASLFPSDRREEPELDLDPIPELGRWPATAGDLAVLRDHFDPLDPARLPQDWTAHVRAGPGRDYPLMVEIHQGIFLSLGVHGWDRFSEVMLLVADNPPFIRAAMDFMGRFSASLLERILREVELDAVILSEPIGGNDRPLISPRAYEELALRTYEPVLETARRGGVPTIILRTYANSRILIPSILKWGIDCLWACETQTPAMDYRDLRREFGRDLRLIGGIDLDALRRGKDDIRREVMEKVPPLLEQGGYVPLLDGRVREDIPFSNYAFYRKLLKMVSGYFFPNFTSGGTHPPKMGKE
jgi:uroporphyrinogen decarboxylase